MQTINPEAVIEERPLTRRRHTTATREERQGALGSKLPSPLETKAAAVCAAADGLLLAGFLVAVEVDPTWRLASFALLILGVSVCAVGAIGFLVTVFECSGFIGCLCWVPVIGVVAFLFALVGYWRRVRFWFAVKLSGIGFVLLSAEVSSHSGKRQAFWGGIMFLLTGAAIFSLVASSKKGLMEVNVKKLLVIVGVFALGIVVGNAIRERALVAQAGGVPNCSTPVQHDSSLWVCDPNADGLFDISDPVLLLNFLFIGGREPLRPCGLLPATGQTECWDTNGAPDPMCIDARHPRQDGAIESGCTSIGRFTDNGDGTVTDACTGLMWQKTPDPALMTWQGALQLCAGLVLAGHDDWRLPNLHELQSIVHFGAVAGQGFQNTGIADEFDLFPEVQWYWTSTTIDDPARGWNGTEAFVVVFGGFFGPTNFCGTTIHYGPTSWGRKNDPPGDASPSFFRVRAVRNR
jgi:hypothetical protein